MIINNVILAYLVMLSISMVLGAGALYAGLKTAAAWNWGAGTEEQHELRKKVYLIISVISICFWMRIFMVPLWFLALGTMEHSIPGAMCLAGVHAAGAPYSVYASALKFILPLFYGFWLLLNRINRKFEQEPATKTLLFSLVIPGILMLIEGGSDFAFLTHIKPRVVSCCTSLFDSPTEPVFSAFSETVFTYYWLFITLAPVTVIFSMWSGKKVFVLASGFFALSEMVLLVLALHTFLSPLLLDSPFHHCIFCLWKVRRFAILWGIFIYSGAGLLLISSVVNLTAQGNIDKKEWTDKIIDYRIWGIRIFSIGVILLFLHTFFYG